jgi:hypothetical protein
MELELVEILKVPDPCWTDFEKSGDERQWAQRQANETRAWSAPTIKGHIEPSRDRPALLDDLFARFAARIAANPKKHEPYMAVTVLAKRS